MIKIIAHSHLFVVFVEDELEKNADRLVQDNGDMCDVIDYQL